MPLLFRWLISAGALMFAAWWVDGIHLAGFGWALLAAALIGVLNVILKPILIILTLPLNIMTLGLFTFVINALILLLVASTSDPSAWFYVSGFWAAFKGALLISLASWLASAIFGDKEGGGGGQTVFWASRRRPGGRPGPNPGPGRNGTDRPSDRIDNDTIDLHQGPSGRWEE